MKNRKEMLKNVHERVETANYARELLKDIKRNILKASVANKIEALDELICNLEEISRELAEALYEENN